MKKYFFMVFTALSLAFVSCNTSEKANSTINLLGDWKVSTINGEPVPETMEEVVISFNKDNGYHGVTGVNLINGTYHQHGNTLTIGEGALTRKMGDPTSNDIEANYLRAIHSTKSVSEKNGKLLLLDSEGVTLMELVR